MQRPDWVDNEMYPFEDRWATVDGSPVHYVDEGNGPPLLMLHGNPTWSFTWRDVIKGLTSRFRCIALDYPGFGLSEARPGYGFSPQEHADTVESFVKQLDLHDVTLLSHDWGGPIGFATAARLPDRHPAPRPAPAWGAPIGSPPAARLPDRFTGFAIANTWAWPMNRNPGAQVFSRFLGGRVGGYLIKHRNFFVETIIPNATKQVK